MAQIRVNVVINGRIVPVDCLDTELVEDFTTRVRKSQGFTGPEDWEMSDKTGQLFPDGHDLASYEIADGDQLHLMPV